MRVGKMIGWIAAASIGGLIHTPAAPADSEMTETWTIAEGGKLYDSWSKVLYYDTKNLPTHPSGSWSTDSPGSRPGAASTAGTTLLG